MTRRLKPPESSSSYRGKPIRLDWRAYFIEFCNVHGEPEFHDHRLIFRDGWSYSSTDYAGPEFPPPSTLNELDSVVLRYWVLRRGRLDKLLQKLQHELKTLQDTQSHHSLPLQQSELVESESGRKREYRPLSTGGLETKIGWVQDDLRECEERLKELAEYYQPQRSA